MGYFGIPFRNGVPIGLGSVAGFGVQQFDPSQLFEGGTVAGAWYDPSDLSTMFTTDAGTTPVAMPGGGAAVSVGRILDKSGNGNHAIAFNNTTARPELRARVNLVLRSEEFDNAYWTKRGLNAFGSGSVANTTATLDPIGGNAADYIQENTAAGTHGVDNNGMNLTAALHTYSVYVKAAQRTWAYVRLATTAGQGAFFDLTNGVVGTVEAGITASIASAGNGWYRCSVSITTSTSPWYPFVGAAPADNTPTYTGDGTSGIYIWGADLRPANIGANVPAYQRIADANTYDTSGFPLYLRFDGIDDSMYTPANLNLSGTDKVAVFAGVRKLSDAASAILTELSSSTGINAGTFYLAAPENASNKYSFYSRGSLGPASAATTASTTYNAPISNVQTGIGNINADQMVLQLNGTQVSSVSSDQGTGSYGTYPLFIGSRNNSSLWLNGHLHSLIIAGSAVSAGNIGATEQWVAGKTGLVLP